MSYFISYVRQFIISVKVRKRVFVLNEFNGESLTFKLRNDLRGAYLDILKEAASSVNFRAVSFGAFMLVSLFFVVYNMLFDMTDGLSDFSSVSEYIPAYIAVGVLFLAFIIAVVLVYIVFKRADYTIADVFILDKNASYESIPNPVSSPNRNEVTWVYKLYYGPSHNDYCVATRSVYSRVEVGKAYRFVYSVGGFPNIVELVEEIDNI